MNKSALLPVPASVKKPGTTPSVERSNSRHDESAAPAAVHDVLCTSGNPLDQDTRQWAEPLFGRDFSHVRVHTDAQASGSAREAGALAYTVGAHVVFGRDQFAPQQTAGRELLAHELAHTVQQSAASSAPIPTRLTISSSGESHADLAARAAAAHQPVPSAPSAPLSLARKDAQEDLAAQRFNQRVARIQKLLSYGVFDWAITDSEATEALRLLQAMSAQERARALKMIRLDRLIDNVPDKLKPELAKIVAESGGEQMVATQVTKIATYSFFDWLGHISESEAKQALGLLEALPPDQRDRALESVPREKRRRLHDALPPAGRARLLQMWDEKEDRVMQRQLEEMHKIERGERLLMRVVLAESNQVVDAFAPQGVTIEVDKDGEVYYAPLQAYVNIAGLTRAEAGNKLSAEFSATAHTRVSVELKQRPAGFKEDYFEPAPQPAAPAPVAPPPKPDPLADRQKEFRDLLIFEGRRLHVVYEQLQKGPKDDKAMQELEDDQEAFNQLYDWFEKHENSPELLKVKPGEKLGDFRAKVIIKSVKASVAKKVREEREAKEDSPEVLEARGKKFDEFLRLMVKLKGESARRFPYSIPIDSEGVDLLVTGDPARQAVLDQIADELMGWSREHMMDDNYTSVDPKSILLYILKSGYDKVLDAANLQPLEHEYIDRHEIIPDTALGAFGETLGKGLLCIGIVGAAVGLGIISGGTAFVVLGGLAAYSGVSSYLDRRKEIEEKGYDVPVPMTMVAAAGDVIGVSQLIEGITGERLHTNERLSSKQRSVELGGGGASVLLLLTGSRAFELGQNLGQGLRLSGPGLIPETVEGVRLADLDAQYAKTKTPTAPVRNPNPGPIEARARAALSERLQVGFDRWMQQMRANPKKTVDIEKVLEKKTPSEIEQICKKPADDYFAQLAESQRVADAKARSASDPLRPKMRHNAWKDGVAIHYENTPPSPEEIAHAQEIQAATGEPVHLFGDTPAAKTYPGIDGTIGEPPRPLQLKDLADPGYLKVHAADAFEAAAKHGYSKVEVHLRVKGSSLAEVKAAWDAPPAHPRGAEIGWETKLSMARSKLTLSSLVIEASDGTWEVPAPPTSPNPPVGAAVPAGKPDDKKTPAGAGK